MILLLPLLAALDTARIVVTPRPERAYVETRVQQNLNFDFQVENRTADTLRLRSVEVSVLDRAGRLVLRRFVDGNGVRPGIGTVPDRAWAGGATGLVFNPFYAWDPEVELAELRYRFRFDGVRPADTASATATVRPVAFRPATDLVLPLAGRVLVWDGHDFLAHHRRWDYTHPGLRGFGICCANPGRYAHDFVAVDTAGAMHSGDGSRNPGYFGWGAPVLAPGAGTVAAAWSAQPDNHGSEDLFDPATIRERPLSVYGNYVVIDHGGGEFSLLGHLQRGSVTVKPGARVAQGQAVGRVGSSGSSMFPHLHYELRTGAALNVEGLPAYFRGFRRLLGSRSTEVRLGPVDSGDFLESSAPSR